MRPRTTTRLSNTASRLWLSAAVVSLLLPSDARAGLWLPLHLTLAGAASVAISGAMQTFTLAMTAAPDPPTPLVLAQLGLVNAGTLLIAIGMPARAPSIVAVGGTLFVVAMLLLGWIVWRAWRRSLSRRHGLPIRLYLFAIACVLAGGGLGALLGAGAVHGAERILALRHAHMTLNVLGWVSVTIAATLVTLLPTTLRIKMPPWHGTWTAWSLAAGVIVLTVGLALRVDALAVVGAAGYALGAAGIAWMVVLGVRTPRRWRVPLAAKHLLCAVAWFLYGTGAVAVVVARDGVTGFVALRETFLTVFVGGWIVQTLLGAWLYLLPMWRPAHPDERRRFLIGIERGAAVQLVTMNAGLALMVLREAGWLPGGAGRLGAGLALVGALLALLKAWLFVPLSRLSPTSARTREIWGGVE